MGNFAENLNLGKCILPPPVHGAQGALSDAFFGDNIVIIEANSEHVYLSLLKMNEKLVLITLLNMKLSCLIILLFCKTFRGH